MHSKTKQRRREISSDEQKGGHDVLTRREVKEQFAKSKVLASIMKMNFFPNIRENTETAVDLLTPYITSFENREAFFCTSHNGYCENC